MAIWWYTTFQGMDGNKVFHEMARSNGKTAFLGNCGNKVLLRLDDEVIFPSGKKVICEITGCNGKTVFLGNCGNKCLLGIYDKKTFQR